MFVVLLKFSNEKSKAGALMEQHNQWIRQGFDDGVFVLVGGIKPNSGGAILAYNTTAAALEDRVASDPFVSANVVTAEIIEISAGRTDPRIDFLLG